jgi:tRNA dimethylallyltransferase
MQDLIVAVVGLTGSGKSLWGMELAKEFQGEIIGADSRQVYSKLDIGTAKPTLFDRTQIAHHCIDHINPRERYSLAEFYSDAQVALSTIRHHNHLPFVVGGTGQYVWALLEGWKIPIVPPNLTFRRSMEDRAERYGGAVLHDELASIDARSASRIQPGNVRRVIRAIEVYAATGRPISAWHDIRNPPKSLIIAPKIDSEQLDRRITDRIQKMFTAGLVDEVNKLLLEGLPETAPGLDSIGYREVVRYLNHEGSLEEAVEQTIGATRRLIRRQRSWFRLNDKRIQWCASLDEARSAVAKGLD